MANLEHDIRDTVFDDMKKEEEAKVTKLFEEDNKNWQLPVSSDDMGLGFSLEDSETQELQAEIPIDKVKTKRFRKASQHFYY